MNYWAKILSHFQEKRYFQNWLTLPFLIGAGSFMAAEKKVLTVEEILLEFADVNSAVMVSVLYCNTIHEYVFALLDRESIELIKGNPRACTGFGNLICIDGSLDDRVDIEDVILKLNLLYEGLIAQGKFSINKQIWTGFTLMDRSRLAEV